MGKYADAEHVTRKKGELRQIGVAFEPLSNASLEPGLSLGGFASQADANAQLEKLATRGVRTAKVVQERPTCAASAWCCPPSTRPCAGAWTTSSPRWRVRPCGPAADSSKETP
jgi:hypothetical protein